MRILSRLFDRALHWSRHPHAERYLAVVSFTESSFFPIPPDVLLAPMALARQERRWRLAALTIITSALGGPLGYLIGYFADAAHRALLPFTVGSLVGRGARYLRVAGLVRWGGAPIEHHIRRYVDGIGWATLGVLAVGYVAWSALRQASATLGISGCPDLAPEGTKSGRFPVDRSYTGRTSVPAPMRIDRYVHDERLTWSAAGVLMLVAAMHLSGIARLLFAPPSEAVAEAPPPIFQVSLQKLPPPRLPPDLQPRPADAPPPPTDAVQQRPRQTRPVPILVDTPTTDPVPPDTQVKKYEMGDELLPGVPGPPMPEGAGDDELYADAAPVEETPVLWNLRLVDMRPPVYPPRCLRLGIEGRVKIRVLVGENGRPQEVTVGESSGESALDQAAIEAVREWRFEPAKRNGVAVRAWAIVPVEFKLID